ncbi:Na(+)-translocating NADH-quinone reductase subunit C [Aestuariibacter sp. AA17]|uniref:Na(+)-translocating NADH-quinone reductase subunit C n=1 Tax=Fluctibacter corallii TaxID=2984329 RepID=A0ABT3A4T4_9ALTE|nr:Na(+)-translocating NADH-quinone reductase subunit C [Aestuariibacter sp. AA17]MCV2883618.1 Na(+)-translocating NADH-quinone reductase subunit C [Aestuariibacter sp. AA17]
MSAKKETLGRTVGIVLAVCLVCSIVVSSAAVGLRSLQEKNAELDKQTNIVEAAGLKEIAKGDIAGTYDKYIEQRFVDLATGEFVEAPSEDYNMYKAAKDKDYNERVENTAVGFQTKPKVASVYLVKNDAGETTRIVLPVHGAGLWDLMYGFLAVDADGNTVRELVYYQHKETPGLGGEIQNPSWKAKWDGKQLYKDGEVAIAVTKGAKEGNDYQVDALSGATLTSNGVQNTLAFWAGREGYAKFLSMQNWKS